MTNDVIQLNMIVANIDKQITELAELGQDGFKVPLVTTPDELTKMIGTPVGPWRPQSNDLLWFCALKITAYAREMLDQSNRIFDQIGEDEAAQRVHNVVQAIDEQFTPCETTLQVYSKLLRLNRHNIAHNGE